MIEIKKFLTAFVVCLAFAFSSNVYANPEQGFSDVFKSVDVYDIEPSADGKPGVGVAVLNFDADRVEDITTEAELIHNHLSYVLKQHPNVRFLTIVVNPKVHSEKPRFWQKQTGSLISKALGFEPTAVVTDHLKKKNTSDRSSFI